ncbi:putative transcription factor bZIP family [Helianthus annuus]|uniref:Putative basic-leucine zipper domain, CCAAT/enhancer-binding protein C/EBP n=1 Tax=Helianthus annuus TaxID=4232 RepID=A0A251S241_HELAN|nr:basic leucine zipper 23 [Helianthus annuus]KAF5761708.1 putative transcription factor bZIP family [Helianthus annuus]KAJ0461885.1 putative transcription factor bZIP family [Helianthus annuus]KAJ0646153.1 putative transcription factor bZIP family [Helianthus annuus]KAJ0822803.1 putative transcription factor bZIP family [Helianthus annuus]
MNMDHGGAPSKLEDSVIDDSVKNRRTCPHTHKSAHASVKLQRPSGNRVAVRKYREKKKAQNAYLEQEVKKLRLVNRALIRKLQLQAALGAEAVRLRKLLMDLKSRIGNELGVSRVYKQSCNGSSDGCIRSD